MHSHAVSISGSLQNDENMSPGRPGCHSSIILRASPFSCDTDATYSHHCSGVVARNAQTFAGTRYEPFAFSCPLIDSMVMRSALHFRSIAPIDPHVSSMTRDRSIWPASSITTSSGSAGASLRSMVCVTWRVLPPSVVSVTVIWSVPHSFMWSRSVGAFLGL